MDIAAEPHGTGSMMISEDAQWSVRPYRAVDERRVISLIDRDRLVAQPPCSWGMLEAARAGRSPYECDRWAALRSVCTDVVADREGDVLGVVSTAIGSTDDVGSVLWLHAGEDRGVVRALMEAAMARLHGRPVVAFGLPSALRLGIKGISPRHRHVTHSVLHGLGFRDAASFLYLHRPLGVARRPRLDKEIKLRHSPDFAGWRVQARDATVDMTVSADGVGWIGEVRPDARHPKIPPLLEHALYLLTCHAAREVVSMVPSDMAERSGLVNLYEDLFFTEVDRLAVLRRP